MAATLHPEQPRYTAPVEEIYIWTDIFDGMRLSWSHSYLPEPRGRKCATEKIYPNETLKRGTERSIINSLEYTHECARYITGPLQAQ